MPSAMFNLKWKDDSSVSVALNLDATYLVIFMNKEKADFLRFFPFEVSGYAGVLSLSGPKGSITSSDR